MARIFTEGFEVPDNLFWSTPGGATATSPVRSGARSWQLNNVAATKNVTAVAEGYARLAVYVNVFGNPPTFLSWRSGSTVLGGLRVNLTTKKLELFTSTGTLVATGNLALQLATWYLLEVRVKIADASGVLEVKLDGTVEATFNGDTKPGADTTFDNLLYNAAGGGHNVHYDDLAFNDVAGGVDDGYPGDGHIVFLPGNAAGDVTQLTPSAGSNFENIDETVPDSDTTYNESATAGQYDLYNLGTTTIPAGGAVTSVWVEARARETAATGDSINLGLKTEATEYDGSNQVVTASYARYVGTRHTVNPNTAAAWTQAQLDALQAKFKVV